MPELNSISPTQLMRQLGTAHAPRIIDVRIAEDLAANPRVIPTTLLHTHTDIDGLITRVAGRKFVLIYHKGLKLSQGAAALLRAAGCDVETLSGGFVAWRAAGLPMVPLNQIPAQSRWVTRHRPKIDRIACPWMIRRFVDPNATFMFVPPSDVIAVAERFDATPYDIEGVHFTHRGNDCTFDALIADFGLTHPALDRLADVVRAADTDRHNDSPQAAGLLAFSVGLSRMYKDDNAQLDAAMPLYDALYRWARDGFEEGHDWPSGRAS